MYDYLVLFLVYFTSFYITFFFYEGRRPVKTMKLSNNGVQVRKDGIVISSD